MATAPDAGKRLAAMTTIGAVSVAAALLAASPAAARVTQDCKTFKVKGHVYGLGVTHTTCALAERWAPVLAGKSIPAHTPNAPLAGAPRGFKCTGASEFSSSLFPGVGAHTQVSGFCRKGTTFSGPYFSWKIKTR